MKVLYLLVWAALAGVALATPAASLLDVAMASPPSRHTSSPLQAVQAAAAVEQEHASLLETGVSAHAALSARVAAETALAVEESVMAAASVEDTVSAKGEMSAEEQALLSRMIPVPNTVIPSDPAVPIEYSSPPTRDTLSTNLGVRGYPWPEKLKAAKTTIESEAKKRISDIRRQMKWSDAAHKLVSQLGLKHSKVNAHVAALTKEIKDLLAKKKQIQNKQLQDKLVERLEQTHSNLKKVRRQTHNIRKNQAQMIHHKEELAHALEGIKRSLAILKGLKRQRQFPQRGAGRKLADELSKFDPDMSHEAEADEVRALQFPDAVLAEVDEQQEEQLE